MSALQMRARGRRKTRCFSSVGIDDEGRIALQVWFDIEDIDAAIAELDTAHARFENERPAASRLDNAANRVVERYLSHFSVPRLGRS